MVLPASCRRPERYVISGPNQDERDNAPSHRRHFRNTCVDQQHSECDRDKAPEKESSPSVGQDEREEPFDTWSVTIAADPIKLEGWRAYGSRISQLAMTVLAKPSIVTNLKFRCTSP